MFIVPWGGVSLAIFAAAVRDRRDFFCLLARGLRAFFTICHGDELLRNYPV
jgi:uncharacterized membrane protein YhfC